MWSYYGGVKPVTALLAAASALLAQTPVAINIDATANRHPISPLIYGVSSSDGFVLADLNAPINRYGGNNTSRYNWQLNADNRGQDWYFESIGETSGHRGRARRYVLFASKNAGAQAMMTIPMIGWVAKLGANRNKLASFSLAKYGAQTGNDWQWFPDAGNGIPLERANVTGQRSKRCQVAVDSAFQQAGCSTCVGKWGTAANGGVQYYILDNEHSIWHSTHRDVHPTGATMDEIRRQDHRLRRADSSRRSVGASSSGPRSGAGAGICSAATTSNTAA